MLKKQLCLRFLNLTDLINYLLFVLVVQAKDWHVLVLQIQYYLVQNQKVLTQSQLFDESIIIGINFAVVFDHYIPKLSQKIKKFKFLEKKITK